MAQGHPTPDEEVLDELFERAVELCEEGAAVDVDALAAGHEHLRAEVEALVRTARLATPLRGERLPKVPGYVVLGEIGRGGMGTVYLARQETLGGRHVALKVLPASSGISPRARERFLYEARTIGSLRHPHIVTVHDVAVGDGVHAYAMEWVDGASLGQVLEHLKPRHAPSSIDDTLNARRAMAEVSAFLGAPAAGDGVPYPIFVCRIGIAVARALGALHRAGLVHRDVKPSNILLRKDGTPLLSDFGLVHAADGELTHQGDFAGTIAYSSPEQLMGGVESLDARSDIYALGVTLYHALALHLPFDDRSGQRSPPSTTAAMLRRIESGAAAPLRTWNSRLPRELETIVGKAIEPQPARRYASADELADDLERMLALQPIRARPAGRLERTAKFLRRNRAATLGVGVGSVLSLGLAAALVVYVFLVPRWVEDHVRRARLSLLDPVHSNRIFTVAFFGVLERNYNVAPDVDERAMLSEALAHYDAALRWAPLRTEIRAERDTVVAALGESAPAIETQSASADWHRRMGLLSFLRGQIESAKDHWEQFESLREPTAVADPLVDAALGVLYLAREEPARAYPRLREACRLFPDVGFLTMYLADAACKCGDLDVAQRMLLVASSLPEGDPNGGSERVRAELLAAQGRDAEAEAVFRQAATFSPANLSFARHLARRGRTDESLDRYALFTPYTRRPEFRAEFDQALERWWNELTEAERLARIRATLDMDPTAPRSLVCRLRLYLDMQIEPEPEANPASGASLAQCSLRELGGILRVQDVLLWSRLAAAPRALKDLQYLAWSNAWPPNLGAALHWIVRRTGTRVPSGEGSLGTVQRAASARHESRPVAEQPIFRGLGDLPGGAYYSHANCLSSDGTSVGGGSSAAADSPFHPFLWRAEEGMRPVGNAPVGKESGRGDAGEVRGLTADGSIAAGWSLSGAPAPGKNQALSRGFLWARTAGMRALRVDEPGTFVSCATAIAEDGSLVFGWADGPTPWTGVTRAVTWTASTVPDLPVSSSAFVTRFECCSRSGRWATGMQILTPDDPATQAAHWSQATGWRLLGGGAYLSTYAVSDAGLVVGERRSRDASEVEACLWIGDAPLRGLGELSGGKFHSRARGVLRDGSLIVGESESSVGLEAVLWDEARALHRIADVLTTAGVRVPSGWRLETASDIVATAAGITICGTGLNPAGETEAWIARY